MSLPIFTLLFLLQGIGNLSLPSSFLPPGFSSQILNDVLLLLSFVLLLDDILLSLLLSVKKLLDELLVDKLELLDNVLLLISLLVLEEIVTLDSLLSIGLELLTLFVFVVLLLLSMMNYSW